MYTAVYSVFIHNKESILGYREFTQFTQVTDSAQPKELV